MELNRRHIRHHALSRSLQPGRISPPLQLFHHFFNFCFSNSDGVFGFSPIVYVNLSSLVLWAVYMGTPHEPPS